MAKVLRNATIVFLALLALLALAGCRKERPVRIGFAGGLSGRNSDMSIAGRDGALLAASDINNSGGINGRSIELLVRDDRSDSKDAELAVQELINSRVDAIIGPMTSTIAATIIPLINTAKVTTLAPTVSSHEVGGKSDYFIRLNLNRDTAVATAGRMVDRLGIKNSALIIDTANQLYTRTAADSFRQEFLARGGKNASEHSFNSGDNNSLLKLATSVLAGKPDGIYIIAAAVDSAMICQQLKKLGSKIPVFIAEWAATTEFLKAGAGSANGVFSFQHFNSDSTSTPYLTFKTAYTRRFGSPPDFAAAYSYEAVAIIAEALARNPDPSQLNRTITSIGNFKGLQGGIKIDRFGVPLRPMSLMQVRNGKFTLVE